MNRGNLEEIAKTWWCGDSVNSATGGEGNTDSTPCRGPHSGSGLLCSQGRWCQSRGRMKCNLGIQPG
jgi:hypothetical protein